jgi:sensor histidine kinase YesM
MTKMKNARFGKSRYMVPHPLYNWYMMRIGLAALLIGAAIGSGSWLYHRKIIDATGLYVFVGDASQLTYYNGVLFLMTVAMSIAVTVVFFLLLGGFLFHRVSGPIYRMHKHMQGIINGQAVTTLQLREEDQLQDVVETYNQLLQRLNPAAKPQD